MKTVVTIVGRLTQDIKPVKNSSDRAVLNVATSYSRAKRNGNDVTYADETLYFSVLCIGKDAKFALAYPNRKGQIVSVQAQILPNIKKVNDVSVNTYGFLCQELGFLEKKSDVTVSKESDHVDDVSEYSETASRKAKSKSK